MIQSSAAQSLKISIMTATGLSRDALHVHVGLAVFLAAVVVLRRPLRSVLPWLVVLAVAVAGELLDLRDDVSTTGEWRSRDSLRDIVNTVLWPTVLLLAARFTSLLRVGAATGSGTAG